MYFCVIFALVKDPSQNHFVVKIIRFTSHIIVEKKIYDYSVKCYCLNICSFIQITKFTTVLTDGSIIQVISTENVREKLKYNSI